MGALEAGRHADILVVDSDPLADVLVLLDKSAIKEVYLEWEPVQLVIRPAQLVGETDNTYRFWQGMYDQKRVAGLATESRVHAI
jgi:membrane protein required for beta-lactamase induction